MEHDGQTNGAWDQYKVNEILDAYDKASSGKDVLFEQLCRLIRSEIMFNLRAGLKDDIAVEEAEHIAFRELGYRMARGRVKFLGKTYVKRYVCATAIRFIRKRHTKVVTLDTDRESAASLKDPAKGPHEEDWLNYADLYFCLDKLDAPDRNLLRIHHYQDLGLEDTAKELGIKHDTARKRHSRAIRKLGTCLESISAGGWS